MTAEGFRPRVEILYVQGCPNHDRTHALVERVAAELRIEPEIELIEVRDADAALQLRFPGSPTVRVNGRDVEPGGTEGRDFVLSCRVYPREGGFAGQPDEARIRAALEGPQE
ncbi:MAG: DF family (seleno)protein [Gaiellaceae bacterium]